MEADSAAQQALLELQVPELLLQFDEPEVVEQALDSVDDQLFDMLHDDNFSDHALIAGAMPAKMSVEPLGGRLQSSPVMAVSFASANQRRCTSVAGAQQPTHSLGRPLRVCRCVLLSWSGASDMMRVCAAHLSSAVLMRVREQQLVEVPAAMLDAANRLSQGEAIAAATVAKAAASPAPGDTEAAHPTEHTNTSGGVLSPSAQRTAHSMLTSHRVCSAAKFPHRCMETYEQQELLGQGSLGGVWAAAPRTTSVTDDPAPRVAVRVRSHRSPSVP